MQHKVIQQISNKKRKQTWRAAETQRQQSRQMTVAETCVSMFCHFNDFIFCAHCSDRKFVLHKDLVVLERCTLSTYVLKNRTFSLRSPKTWNEFWFSPVITYFLQNEMSENITMYIIGFGKKNERKKWNKKSWRTKTIENEWGKKTLQNAKILCVMRCLILWQYVHFTLNVLICPI